jgi:DNA polymerase III alpha subunit
MEDEHGQINVIVKPDIYERDRTAVRMEPFLAVTGKLQKDGGTINVIAHEVQAIRVPGTPIRRRGLSGSYATADAPTDEQVDEPVADPYRYLTELRQNAPGAKSFG